MKAIACLNRPLNDILAVVVAVVKQVKLNSEQTRRLDHACSQVLVNEAESDVTILHSAYYVTNSAM